MISSTSNPRIKQLVQYKKKKKARDADQVFLVEGLRLAGEIPAEKLVEVYVTSAFKAREQAFLSKLPSEKVIEVTDTVFAYAADTKTPQGVLGVVRQNAYSAQELIQNHHDFVMVLEDVQDPGNVGTILRSAEAAGVSSVILSENCADVYNPKTTRSTMGSIFRVPFAYTADLPGTVKKLKEQGTKIYAGHLKGSTSYDIIEYDKKVAILIGNEGAGLSEEISGLADDYIVIPMEGKVESLNAAISATILMFEVARRRRGGE